MGQDGEHIYIGQGGRRFDLRHCKLYLVGVDDDNVILQESEPPGFAIDRSGPVPIIIIHAHFIVKYEMRPTEILVTHGEQGFVEIRADLPEYQFTVFVPGDTFSPNITVKVDSTIEVTVERDDDDDAGSEYDE